MDAALELLGARSLKLDLMGLPGAYEIVREQRQAFRCRDRIAG